MYISWSGQKKEHRNIKHNDVLTWFRQDNESQHYNLPRLMPTLSPIKTMHIQYVSISKHITRTKKHILITYTISYIRRVLICHGRNCWGSQCRWHNRSGSRDQISIIITIRAPEASLVGHRTIIIITFWTPGVIHKFVKCQTTCQMGIRYMLMWKTKKPTYHMPHLELASLQLRPQKLFRFGLYLSNLAGMPSPPSPSDGDCSSIISLTLHGSPP